MKKIRMMLLTLAMLMGSCAAAEPVEEMQMQFAGGLEIRLSAGWNAIEVTDEMQETGSFHAVISADGTNLCQISYHDAEFSEPAYETEVKDWFEDEVFNLIPRGARFTIKDVSTGKSFEAVRFAGNKHMDTEPYSAEDAATIKAIFGGQYSWDCRPILIRYEGRVYAASMNGKPHANQATSGNDFDGHFCVHFKNSLLHEVWVVDAAHQVAVQKAASASW